MARPGPPTYDVFLAFCPAATLLASELPAIGLDAAARIVAVDLHYRAETDVALIGLRLDASLGSEALLSRLRLEAANAGASVLEPARLESADRARFYREHLAQYRFKMEGFPTVADAGRKLAADLGAPDRPAAAGGSPRVQVRFRAGDGWRLARARNLTREGFYVYAGSPPRLGEVVQIALEAGGASVTLPATVVHVTPDDAAVTVGGPGFGGRFSLEGPEQRAALERIVVAGRGDGLGALRAAPSRREARYAVRWPVAVNGGPRVVATDLSRHGLFVATEAAHPRLVELRIADDAGDGDLQARAHVARAVTPAAASARGLTAGVGLEIDGFAPFDEARYDALVRRVARRAGLRLLVGAPVARGAVLVDRLVSAGYVVAGHGEPADLEAQVARARPDLVVLETRFRARLPPEVEVLTLEPDRDAALLASVDAVLL